MVNVEWLRYFVALAETPNFTQAAEKLHISPQTMSHAIAGLERHFQQQLVQRGQRMKGFTPAGEALLVEARGILASLENTDRLMTGFRQDAPTGPLRIAGTTIVNSAILPNALATLTERYPEVTPKLYAMRSAEIENRVAAGDVDLGFFMRAAGHADVRSQELARSAYVLVGQSPLPGQWHEWGYVVPRQFDSEPPIQTSCHSERQLAAMRPAGSGPRRVVAESDQFETTLGLCEAGVGVSFLPELVVRDRLQRGSLIIVAAAPCQVEEPLTVVWRKGVRRTAAASTFLEILHQLVAPAG